MPKTIFVVAAARVALAETVGEPALRTAAAHTCIFTGLSPHSAHNLSSGFHVCSWRAPESCDAA